jgi:pimeloyl-ACP methyl ester carboxylesterase
MSPSPRPKEVRLPVEGGHLDGLLAPVPAATRLALLLERSAGLLAEGRGSLMAAALRDAGMSTLQVAMLSRDEERHSPDIWDQVTTLTQRLDDVITWIERTPELARLSRAVVARDATAAATVRFAAQQPDRLAAIACRGGRADLAGLEPLRRLQTPILLVVGDQDEALPANRLVAPVLTCPNDLVVLAGASHTLAEPGALDEASRLVIEWFERWLQTDRRPGAPH